MATTTNYGWTTPDDTALVKDGAAAIRTLGSSVDTTTKALNPSTTLGDLEYRSATANTNTRLAIGTTGQVLTVAGGVPSWATPAGGGKVLQVVTGTTTTTATIASTSFTDTNLTATITPSSTGSRIAIFVTQPTMVFKNNDVTTANGNIRIMRGATSINEFADAIGNRDNSSGTHRLRVISSLVYIDSPNSTSAITYKTQAKVDTTADAGQIVCQENSNPAFITLMEIGA